MKKHLVPLAALSLSAAFMFAAPGVANNGKGAPRTFGTSTAPCNDGTVAASPAILWPPNHKFTPVDVTYSTAEEEQDGDEISITNILVNGVDNGSAAVDENGEGNGSGPPFARQGADYTVPATLNPPVDDSLVWHSNEKGDDDIVSIRSERAGTNGNGSGRVYTITVTCHDEGGTDPTSTLGMDDVANVAVCVPHDQSDKSVEFCKLQVANPVQPE